VPVHQAASKASNAAEQTSMMSIGLQNPGQA
jgi:hypothetical protein